MSFGNEKNIRLLLQGEIDSNKWDACISMSPNGLIYARYLYLNQMAKNWNALILNNYEAVMPLPWNRKYGIHYLYQPPFTAQLGIFSTGLIDQSLINSFILHCKKHFLFCELHMNYENRQDKLPERTNYILSLNPDYEDIRRNYKKDLLQNLKKTNTDILNYEIGQNYQKVIELYKYQYGKRFPHVTKNDYQQFSALCFILLQKGMLLVRNVHDIPEKKLLSAAIFLKDDNRIYNIMAVTLPEGRKGNAQHFLLDQLIKEFSGQKLILDFEGSEIAGIAEFYRKFGSISEPYPFLRFNRLPFPFKYLKRNR